MKLKPGCEVEYEKRHRAIWPELVKLLKETGVSEYSIFWDKETNLLFAVQEQAGDSGSQDLGTNPVVKKWWDYMADIMDVNPDNSPVSIPLKEVFYMKLKKTYIEIIFLFIMIILNGYIYMSYFPKKYYLNKDLTFNKLSSFDNNIMTLSGIVFLISILFLFIKLFKYFFYYHNKK